MQPTTLHTPHYPIHIGHGAVGALRGVVEEAAPDGVFVLADSNTAIHCLPRLEAVLGTVHGISIPAGEAHKHMRTCESVWAQLSDARAGRDALLINLGGGMVGDLGGFVAACYKRGIRFVQVPTSLLAMVDASVGGKTGVNFLGYKNMLGAFQDPLAVVVDPGFLPTLPPRELRAGYAEVLKHALIADATQWDALAARPELPDDWEAVIRHSIAIKARIVAADPLEKGLRAVLNFGHTVGHALESASLAADADPLLHGEAVALGMAAEAWLSWQAGMLPLHARDAIVDFLLNLYGPLDRLHGQDEAIATLCLQDKKNAAGQVRCALLSTIGACTPGITVARPAILQSLQHIRASA